MPKRPAANRPNRSVSLPDSPFTAAQWNSLLETLNLSPQQARIADLIFRGLKDKEIAAQLGISFSTVRTYLDRIFASLGVSDRSGLMIHVFKIYNRNGHAKHS